ncbi:MAG: glycogen synthase GlgA [Clostridia bacterium]|nr:MAG: glycogen synthase GlgA [Clostridia bacterium]
MPGDRLNVLVVSSEIAPFAKTGGLADVTGSLPKALAAYGHDVRLALPRYKFIKGTEYLADLPVEMDGHLETAIVRGGYLPAGERSLPVYFVDNYRYFYRDNLYGYPDEGQRFHFFAKAVLAMLPKIAFRPDIIHCNDWQTALIPLFLKVKYADEPFYQRMATVFTIHNLQYQGLFPQDILRKMGLGHEFFTPEELEYYGKVNFLKAGLLYADILNTVSKKYALEIQTPDMGEGLDGLLRKRADVLRGILNGIDYDEFNPATDTRIPVQYDVERLELKQQNKKALQEEMDLSPTGNPVIGIISRLVNQKGLDLVAGIMDQLMQQDVQLVLLGAGDDYYRQLFSRLKLRYRDRVGVRIGFDPVLAQHIYAGADIFLMPSRFEPCGLGQMIAMRYGTVPVVRATGGLEDTVIDYHRDKEHGNGFSFVPYTPQALWDTLQRALQLFRQEPDAWQQLMKRGMRTDFSWEESARHYEEIYYEAIRERIAAA